MLARIVLSRWIRRAALMALAIAPLAAVGLCSTANAQTVVTLAPLASFGSNGWIAPGTLGELVTADNNQRGMAVNPINGNVILPSRSSGTAGNNVWVLNATTGTVSGMLPQPVGNYSGGTFVINNAGVGADGAVYVGNLATSAASAFKVYKWASDSDFSTPATVAYSGTFAAGGAPRFGDAFAVYGSGTSAIFAAAGSNSTVANVNSYFAVGSLDSLNTRTAFTQVINSSTSTAGNNGYRLGLSFTSGTSLLGTQGSVLYSTTFSSTVSANVASGTGWSAAMRPISYLNLSGTAYVATIDTNSSTVSVFNISNPATPLLSGTGNATVGPPNANVNASGGIGWGPFLGNDLNGNPQYTLYAMNTNNGIQAFTVTFAPVPEPSTWALLGTAAGVTGLAGYRRRNRRRSGTVAAA
jgi:hypothetical protein